MDCDKNNKTLIKGLGKNKMFKNLNKANKIALIIAGAFIAFVVLPFISWIITDEGIKATSDSTFCVGCHSMDPFDRAHEADVHGGQNAHAVVSCIDCHLVDASDPTATQHEDLLVQILISRFLYRPANVLDATQWRLISSTPATLNF
jgi:hypothetical protein